jgi:hypothetical protein
MSKIRRLTLLAVLVAAVVLAVFGAGWKWQEPCHGHAYGGPEKVAGWTWDESDVLAD